ncbi:hypothetical protein SAMN04487850_2008 [Prevotella aff. ruminicola Tc2-24]|jgi:hypothetical protein|uniref:Uncharacterized protein n=1 Tax=Prevotella aff. ruminicola Tc2-24 TaxID=81582 RepID=A0A1I0PX64_9BACT|nr:hypothetical protein [Prevotella aff. ruminicola Tc2-24]SEW18914.1 hypothetical protein SAMN04487850_2008 [Prevotella aff. ruminicola Tc2-24]
MLPVKKTSVNYRTLDEIRLRKEEIAEELERDNSQFTTLWNRTFIKREGNTKGEYVAGLITNSITAIDAFLLIRKLMKGYGGLFRRKKH